MYFMQRLATDGDSLHLVFRAVAELGKDDDGPGVDLYALVELLPSHVPHTCVGVVSL